MYGKFLVEGDKLVKEVLVSEFKISAIYALEDYALPDDDLASKVLRVSKGELEKISTHESPNQVVAVAEIPPDLANFPERLPKDLYLACDNLSDPGNLGTIIRTAEWFGIKHVFLSENTVDIYNPKVVSAAKGSLFRIKCHHVSLKDVFRLNDHLPVYGTFLTGTNIYQTNLTGDAFVLIGNEASGISNELGPFIAGKLTIPSFGKAESLNASVAAGIILSEFKKRTFKNGI